MKSKSYFESKQGIGLFSTADKEGRVTSAIFGKPHFLEDGSIAFIFTQRKNYSNLKENPYACYLFLEEGPGYNGKRLYLRLKEEINDKELMKELCKRCKMAKDVNTYLESKRLLVFDVEKELPLLGE